MDGAWPAGGSWGVALFTRQGMAAWMHAWPPQIHQEPSEPKRLRASTAPPVIPAPLSGSLVTVLANMVLTARQEVHA